MNIFIMILLISVLILVHELGHFLAARMFGIKVTKFGFGLPFGPTLFEKKIGDTTFYIHAFLLGGYVSFPDDDKDSDLPDDSPELFKNKPVGQRAIVVSAGVFANVLCAIALVLITAFAWGKLPSNQHEVIVTRLFADKNVSIKNSGMQPNDKIVSINGIDITHVAHIRMFALASKPYNGVVQSSDVQEKYDKLKQLNAKLNLENDVVTKNTIINLPAITDETPVKLNKMEMYGVENKKQTGKITLNKIQLELRDKLKNLNKYTLEEDTNLMDIAIAISDSQTPLMIVVDRDGILTTLNKVYPNKDGVIGIEHKYKELYVPTKGFISGLVNSWNYLYDSTETMIWSLGQLFLGKVPLKELHGIVAITKVGGDVIAQQGLFKGLLFTAMISLNLAIVNLLPIPALDGGHLIFLLIEKIKGRPINEEIVEKIGNAVFIALIAFMVLIIFNDVVGIINNKF